MNADQDLLCGGATNGYKIAFHLPNELPHVWKKNYHVSVGQAATLMAAPIVISTSTALRNHHPVERQCYFNAERQLKLYQYYSQHNCEAGELIDCGIHWTNSAETNERIYNEHSGYQNVWPITQSSNVDAYMHGCHVRNIAII